jgi:hypothetical protein
MGDQYPAPKYLHSALFFLRCSFFPLDHRTSTIRDGDSPERVCDPGKYRKNLQNKSGSRSIITKSSHEGDEKKHSPDEQEGGDTNEAAPPVGNDGVQFCTPDNQYVILPTVPFKNIYQKPGWSTCVPHPSPSRGRGAPSSLSIDGPGTGLVPDPLSITGTKGTDKRMENETKRVGISPSRPIIYNGESCPHSISLSLIP